MKYNLIFWWNIFIIFSTKLIPYSSGSNVYYYYYVDYVTMTCYENKEEYKKNSIYTNIKNPCKNVLGFEIKINKNSYTLYKFRPQMD